MSSLPAATPGVLVPNQYVLGGKGVRVEYSATSITGDPLLHYRDATHDVGGEVSIITNAVLTRGRFARLPADAQLQTYRVVPIRGSATFVVS